MELSARFPGKLRMMLSSNPYIRYHIDKKATALEDMIDLFACHLELQKEKQKKTVDK